MVLIGGGLGAAGIWAASTILVYLLSQAVGGSRSVTRTAANVAWAALPLLIVNSVSTATVLALSVTGRLPAITSPAAMPFWLIAFNSLTGLLGYLLTYAIHDARDLEVRRAGLVPGPVITISLRYSVSQIL